MRWTPENVAELRELAESGASLRSMGNAFGCCYETVRVAAIARGIAPHRFTPPDDARKRFAGESPESLRARWSKLIGPMREQLRADIGSM